MPATYSGKSNFPPPGSVASTSNSLNTSHHVERECQASLPSAAHSLSSSAALLTKKSGSEIFQSPSTLTKVTSNGLSLTKSKGSVVLSISSSSSSAVRSFGSGRSAASSSNHPVFSSVISPGSASSSRAAAISPSLSAAT